MADKKTALRAVLSVIIALVFLVLIVVGGYLLYVVASFSRIPDNVGLEVKHNTEAALTADGEYSVITYNVGFGAYSPDYTFFMDTGEMDDGTKTQGEHGTAVSEEEVRKNIAGSSATVKALDPDFAIIQEVDYDSTRSYKVDQRLAFTELADYASVFAENYHSSYLLYPFSDPHGKNNAGIVTLSKYKISSSVRRSFPIDTGFSKFTDLDRCFSVTRVPLGEKEFVLISLHMSAYDEGGVIRKQQADMLSGVLAEEYSKGNYVVAGGDFNQDLIGDLGKFRGAQKIPEWVSTYGAEDIPSGFSIVADKDSDIGSCRGADVVWKRGWTYTCVIDGFIVSDNISVKSVEIIEDGGCDGYSAFAYSDHNPVKMIFSFN